MNNKKLENKYVATSMAREDQAVFDFLVTLKKGMTYEWLEAGAGLGRFAFLVKNESPKNLKANIVCLEINKKLVDHLEKTGLQTINESVQRMSFNDETFDLVHASHLIEHFSYPTIIDVLDELFRVTKKNGYVIIRSPLMYSGFWNDIDHVRPYPPKCILQYFDHAQQQRGGQSKIRLIHSWLRQEAITLNSPNWPGFLSWPINWLLKSLWIATGYPKDKANGYVAVFQKI